MIEHPDRKFLIAVEKALMQYRGLVIDAEEFMNRVANATEWREQQIYEWLKAHIEPSQVERERKKA